MRFLYSCFIILILFISSDEIRMGKGNGRVVNVNAQAGLGRLFKNATPNPPTTPGSKPALTNDSFTVKEDDETVLDVLMNDKDSGVLSVGRVLGAREEAGVVYTMHGAQLTITHDKRGVLYSPKAQYTGPDSFRYSTTRKEEQGVNVTSSSSTYGYVSITVSGVNDKPAVHADAYIIVEDSFDNALVVTENDVDLEGDAFKVTMVTLMSSSALGAAPGANADDDVGGETRMGNKLDFGLKSTRSQADLEKEKNNKQNHKMRIGKHGLALYFTPAPDFTGVLTYEYTLTQMPKGNNTIPGVELNCHDNGMAVSKTARSEKETHNNAANTRVNKTDDGSYAEKDGDENEGRRCVSVKGLLTVTVLAVNDNPHASSDQYVVEEDAESFQMHVLDNDYDMDEADILRITEVGEPDAGGSVIIHSDHGYYSLVYTPKANYSGVEKFNYCISDRLGSIAYASVNVTVSPVNDSPVASNDSFSAVEDAGRIRLSVLDNDFDIDGDKITIISVDPGSQGGVLAIGEEDVTPQSGSQLSLSRSSTTSLYAHGYITYTPAPDFEGVETFRYYISDGHRSVSHAVVTIYVAGQYCLFYSV